LVAAGLAVAAFASPPSTAAVAAQDDQPLEAAGRAAAHVTFTGSMEVTWSDEQGEHSQTLSVQGGNGSVVVRGSNEVMASPQQRLVEHAGGSWDLLWPVTAGVGGRPAPGLKYQLQASPGPTVSGRTTRLVEVRQGGEVLERLYLDDATNLLLRREQFDRGAGPFRTVGFESITFNETTPAPEFPNKVVNHSPKTVSAGHLPSGVSAPGALAGKYQRLGLYRRPGVVQVVYSDGLYDLSVFQQRGRLDRAGLPSATRVAIGSANGWHYSWPGGHVVVWEGAGTVYTGVSDAPLDQVLAALRSLPPVSAPSSLLSRLRQACRTLIDPLGA
jgi:sigma-E factor negative regulatory protein RseB